MNLHLITIGKLTKEYQPLADKFSKRIKMAGHNLTVIELKECKDKNPQTAMKKEGDLINSKIKASSLLICLDKGGQQLPSEKLATQFNNWQLDNNNLTLVIGGPWGIDSELLKKSDFKLSFSLGTFNHQLIRIILLEQLYRALNILSRGNYHK